MLVRSFRGFIEQTRNFAKDDKGIGVVELILILVEKPNAKHRYVLCGK